MKPRTLRPLLTTLLMLGCAAQAQAAGPPTIGEPQIVERHPTSVSIEVAINPNDGPTKAYMEFGRTRQLGGRSGELTFSGGSNPVPATVNLDNLVQGKTYYFRFTATNAAGTTTTEIRSFDTTVPASQPVLAPPVVSFALSTGPGGATPWRILAVSRPNGLPKGTRVSVRCRSACKGGRSFTIARGRSLQAAFRPPIRITRRSVVEVRATKKGYVGRVRRYRFQHSGSLILAIRTYNRCLVAGQPAACPKSGSASR